MKRMFDLERRYQEVFSLLTEEKDLLRYRDDKIKDMYGHNFTQIRSGVGSEEVKKIIEDEKKIRKEEGADFLSIISEDQLKKEDIPQEDLESFTDIEFYEIPKEALYRMKDLRGLEVIVLSDVLMEEAEELDEFCASNETELEFSKRRFRRRAEVYLSDEGPDNYLAMLDWEAVGSCDFFSDGHTCMLEDLIVDPEFRNKGVATSLLKELAWKAFSEGNDLVYLKTYSNETAKDMYRKLGFRKIHTSSCALYRF